MGSSFHIAKKSADNRQSVDPNQRRDAVTWSAKEGLNGRKSIAAIQGGSCPLRCPAVTAFQGLLTIQIPTLNEWGQILSATLESDRFLRVRIRRLWTNGFLTVRKLQSLAVLTHRTCATKTA